MVQYPRTISLNGNRALINRVKKVGLKTYNPKGEWNGYGYERLPLVVELNSVGDVRKYNKIVRELEATPEKPKKDPIEQWCKRLCKLTGISIEEAQLIAQEKLDYQERKIDELEERQYDRYSSKRATLINQMRRANPLRRIQDEEHAQAILSASKRHSNTLYDVYLSQYHDEEQVGRVVKGYAKEYARRRVAGEPPEIIEEYEEEWGL